MSLVAVAILFKGMFINISMRLVLMVSSYISVKIINKNNGSCGDFYYGFEADHIIITTTDVILYIISRCTTLHSNKKKNLFLFYNKTFSLSTVTIFIKKIKIKNMLNKKHKIWQQKPTFCYILFRSNIPER